MAVCGELHLLSLGPERLLHSVSRNPLLRVQSRTVIYVSESVSQVGLLS